MLSYSTQTKEKPKGDILMKKQKGVNPLIATILLLLVCMAIAGVIWGWLQGFTQTFAGCSGASFTIDLSDVKPGYNATLTQTRMVLLNKGDRDLNNFNITSFYSDGSSDTNDNVDLDLQKGGSVVAWSKGGGSSKPERIVVESVDCAGIKTELASTQIGTLS